MKAFMGDLGSALLTARQGMKDASNRVVDAAQKISSAFSSKPQGTEAADTTDQAAITDFSNSPESTLSSAAVELSTASLAYEANAKVFERTSELEKKLLDEV